MVRRRLNNRMHVVGHHDPCVEPVALGLEMAHSPNHELRDFWLAQPVFPNRSIKQRIDLFGIPIEESARPWSVGCALFDRRAAQQVVSGFPQASDCFARQRIGETERNEIGRAFDFDVR